MSKEERHLQTKIRMFEDILLRTKNPSQVDNIQMAKSSRQHPNGIDKDESKIAKIILQENGVLTRALSFFVCIVLPLRLF